MENIVFWMIVGIAAGWMAKWVMPGEASSSIVSDFVVGIIGALAGGFLSSALLGHSYGGGIGSTAVAFIGAVVLLFVVSVARGMRYVDTRA